MKHIRLASLLMLVSLAASTLLSAYILRSGIATALSGSDFQAGHIIDDTVFFNTTTMSATDIQYLLNIKVPSCDTNGTKPYGSTTRAAYGTSRGYPPPYTCLKDYRQDTPVKSSESGLCNGYGGGNKSASEIIFAISNTCGINPQVLIILLEKEQSLIDDEWPWSVQYRSATGYGCPDTAPCDTEYYGFFNQVYSAARQFKRYARDSNLYNYKANTTSYILYNPTSSCGGSNVYIQNQATANLYNYTPYQPNQSALNNLYGSGDSCGAYGNRNFWRLFNDWFGTTYGNAIGQNAYRQYGTVSKDHYYTARENDRFNSKKYAGFRDDGVAFKVGNGTDPNMIPIYSMYNGRLSDHWLVTDGLSRYWGIVYGGYRDEGVAFYAFPANSTGSSQICTQGIPVYQMWHGGFGDHYYSTSSGDRYWSLIHGGYVDDKSGNNNTEAGSVGFCVPQ